MYVVLARDYEYNDETYERSDGGNVVHAYSTYEAAEAARLRLTVESLKNGGMAYLAEQYDVFSGAVCDMLETFGFSLDGRLDYYVASDISEAIRAGHIGGEYLIKLAGGIKEGYELYFIQRVEVD